MKVGEAFVEVRADTSKFGPELSQGVESSGKQAASGLSQALTAGIAVAGFSKLIGAASDLTEASNKVGATFGASAGQVEDFASTSAESLGIAESAALDLAGGLGSMLIPLGISQEEAAGMSTAMLSLAADMGSFNNQDPTEMLERIRSGLAGESEPLRQFGSNLSEARVQQFAWQEGIAESGVALTEQQKVLSRYGLLLEDTSIQQGDFTRTSGEAANAQRIAAATAEDSAASIGENFLPVYKQGVAAVTELAGAFGKLPGPLQAAGVLLAGFAAFKGPLTGMFTAVTSGIGGMVARFREAGGAAAGFQAALSPGTLAAGGAIIGIGLITAELAENAAEAKHAEENMQSLADAFAEGGRRAVGETLIGQLREDIPDVIPMLEEANVGVQSLLSAADDAEAFDSLIQTIAEANDIDFQVTGGEPIIRDRDLMSLRAMRDGLNNVESDAALLASQTERNAAASDTASSSYVDQAAALDEVATSADSALDALESLFGIQRTAAEGMIAVREGARGLMEALAELGEGGFRRGTEDADAFESAMQSQLQTISEQAVAMRANGSSIQEVRAAQRGWVADAVTVARAAGVPEAAIREMVETFGTVPRQLLTDVEQRGAEDVQRQAGDTREAINRIPKNHDTAIRGQNSQAIAAINEARRAGEAWSRMTYTAQLQAALGGGIPGAAFGRRAAGGPVEAGRAYLVGEAGPELMIPGASGTIIPNGGGGAAVGVGGVTVVVEGNVIGDVDRFADEIAFRAAEKISRGAI